MIDGGWSALPLGRKALLLLALIGAAYLFLQTRTAPMHLSNWSGAGMIAAPAGISGEAVAQTGRGLPSDDPGAPSSDPLGNSKTVMTQGYGVGSHAPANIWGAVDLAIDGDGDGQADPQGTDGAPVYATIGGVVHLARDTYPAGNHIWLEGDHFKIGYSHLKDFAVQDGQKVERGQVIGYVGATGEASGPHLDYQVWKDGANVNPLDYGALDAMK